MMKLVTKLAKKFSIWPCQDGASIYSTDSGMIWDTEGETHGQTLYEGEFEYESVTRAQWEAERSRIASESSPKVTMSEKDREFVNSDFYQDIIDRKREQELAAIACGKRSKEDQELWDDIAVDLFKRWVRIGDAEVIDREHAMFAMDAADHFMAERAKRMKG